MNKAPCKDCPDRQVGCHINCEEYLAFAKEKRELNEAINKARHEEQLRKTHRSYIRYNIKIRNGR